MRIHSVEIAGFGPFLEPQRIDFEAFADHGIFLIQGRTGAGKSSILDAVVYALFNSAPRYASRAAEHLRSHHCGPDDPTWVELEFSVDGQRYRLRRSPEFLRPKARGDGLTPERATARLWRREGDDWVALEASVRTVAQALDDLLPLSHAQFLQVVMLAQGEFERFLVAESAERKEVLGRLFDTRRFHGLDELLQRRVNEQRETLARATSATDTLLATLATHLEVELPEVADDPWLTETTNACAAAAAAATRERDIAQSRMEETRGRLDAARDLRARQERRAALEARRQVLASRADEVDSVRLRVDRALAAAAVRPSGEAFRQACARHDEWVAAAEKARLSYEESVGVPVPEDLGATRDHLVATIPALVRAAEAEHQLTVQRTELGALEASVAETEKELAALAESAQQCEALLSRPLETTVEEAARRVHELMDEVARATRHEDAVLARQKAEVAALRAGERRTRASAQLDELRRRTMEEFAGRLAEALVDGEPCQVCGSAVHPAPATRGTAPVQEETLERAHDELDEAQAAAVRAESELASARTLEAAHGSSLDLTEARKLLQQATERHARTVTDARARDEAQAELARTREALQRAEVMRAELTTGVKAMTHSVDRLSVEVDEARDGSASVADRLEGLDHQLRLVDGVISTTTQLERSRRERDQARLRLDQELVSHGFGSLEAAAAADLPDHERDALGQQVRRHDESWAVVLAGLGEATLQDLPSEPVDVEGPRLATEQAAAELEAAASRAGVAHQRRATADRLAAQVRAAWARDEEGRRHFEVLRRLAATLHGEPPNTRRMRLESYVLAVELEQIVQTANRRLGVMSAGRYELLLNDRVATRGNNAGLEVRVLDQHTQESRTPESLSGGEKFLASLALALGLAEVVTERAGGVMLDTLFIDEGFGSLDAETLDLALHSLDQLREHGRVVGVISHVEAMKERIPAQLVVDVTAGGWSTVVSVT